MVGKSESANYISWHPIFIGSIVVWIMACSRWAVDLVAGQKNTLAVLMVVCYLIVFFYIVILKNKRDKNSILKLILLGGFLLRGYYVLAAPYDITTHDTGSFKGFDTQETGGGHFGYIEYLYKNQQLPDFDPRTRWSFYNPPGFHIIGAIVLGITRLFDVEPLLCYESLQVINLFFSSLAIWTGYRILEEFSIQDKWMVLFTAFLSVHPFYSIMTVTLTNDCTAMYLMLLAVWYTIRWYKSPEMKNIIIIALAVGLAMFVKINAAIIAFGIGIVFVCVFWKKFFLCFLMGRQREFRKVMLQFIVFLLICAPIGLFNPIRNMVKFHMPFTYVQQIELNSWQYIPNQTIASRIGVPSLEQMSYPFISYDTQVERNIWIQALRTALFDEIRPDVGSGLFRAVALILLWSSIVLVVLMNILLLYSICKKNTMKGALKLFLITGYAAFLLSYIQFCINEPFICTMSYRYIPIGMFFPLIGSAVWIKGQENKQKGLANSLSSFIQDILACGIVCFVVMAVIVNLNLIAYTGIKL